MNEDFPQLDTSSDAILFYNVGMFGTLGYGVPNWANKSVTLNTTVKDMCDMWGKALSDIMHTDDAMLPRPPSMNVVFGMHQAFVRSAQILRNAAVAENQFFFEPGHSTPTPKIFRVYPAPCFKVVNKWLSRWCENVMRCISHMMQHTENRRQDDVSEEFTQEVGTWLNRIYVDMAADLFKVPIEEARAPGFLLTKAHFDAYAPTKHVLVAERSNVVAPVRSALTEDSRKVIYEGILVTQLPKLSGYPVDPLIGQYLSNSDLLQPGSQAKAAATTVNQGMPVTDPMASML